MGVTMRSHLIKLKRSLPQSFHGLWAKLSQPWVFSFLDDESLNGIPEGIMRPRQRSPAQILRDCVANFALYITAGYEVQMHHSVTFFLASYKLHGFGSLVCSWCSHFLLWSGRFLGRLFRLPPPPLRNSNRTFVFYALPILLKISP